MNTVFLMLGSNLGNRSDFLFMGRQRISERVGKLLLFSSIYETDPWGFSHKNSFLNQCLMVSTPFPAVHVLGSIRDIEREAGREDTSDDYKPRTLDIDILLYNNDIISHRELTIPHPLLHLRRFVLVPLCEIAPEYVHPELKKSIRQLLDECGDILSVKKDSETD